MVVVLCVGSVLPKITSAKYSNEGISLKIALAKYLAYWKLISQEPLYFMINTFNIDQVLVLIIHSKGESVESLSKTLMSMSFYGCINSVEKLKRIFRPS